MTPIEREKLDVLNGDRGDKSRAAVRQAALRALVNGAPVDLTSKQVSAAPTMAEYNALQADVQALYSALNALRIALQ